MGSLSHSADRAILTHLSGHSVCDYPSGARSFAARLIFPRFGAMPTPMAFLAVSASTFHTLEGARSRNPTTCIAGCSNYDGAIMRSKRILSRPPRRGSKSVQQLRGGECSGRIDDAIGHQQRSSQRGDRRAALNGFYTQPSELVHAVGSHSNQHRSFSNPSLEFHPSRCPSLASPCWLCRDQRQQPCTTWDPNPTTIHPPSFWVTPALSVPGRT